MTICIICKIIQPDLRSPNAIGWARVVQHTHTYKGIENNKHVFISERDECHFCPGCYANQRFSNEGLKPG